MPAWPGGPCPNCGEDMPPSLIRCYTCRTLLNDDLNPAEIEKPEYVPLPEITPTADAVSKGAYLQCPNCDRELRIRNKYRGEQVRCKHCRASFTCDFHLPEIAVKAHFADCPHCGDELRAAVKYLNLKVSCKHCGGNIRFRDTAKA